MKWIPNEVSYISHTYKRYISLRGMCSCNSFSFMESKQNGEKDWKYSQIWCTVERVWYMPLCINKHGLWQKQDARIYVFNTSMKKTNCRAYNVETKTKQSKNLTSKKRRNNGIPFFYYYFLSCSIVRIFSKWLL